MQLRKTGLAAILGAAALAIAACGGGSGGGATSAASSAASSAGSAASSGAGSAAETSAAAGGGGSTEGSLLIWADDKYADVMTQVGKQFGEANGITVNVELIAKDLQTQFVTASQAGTGPDLTMGAHDWIGNLVQNGAVDPVPMSDAVQQEFLEKAVEGVTFNGQIYGVPYAVENVVLYRNTALAPEAPATWEDLLAQVDQIKASNPGVTNPLAIPVGPEGDAYHSYPMFSSGGGEVFGTDADGNYDANQLLLGSPESIAAMSKIGANGETGTGLLTRSVDPNNVVSIFTDQKAPFMLSGPWNLPGIKQAGTAYDISPAPKWADGGEARPFVGVQAMYVAAKGKNKAIAQEFATNYFATVDVAQQLYDAQPRPPALKEVYEAAAASDPDIKKFVEAGENGDIMPSITAMAAVFGPWGKGEAAIVGGADPAATMTDTAAALEAAIGG